MIRAIIFDYYGVIRSDEYHDWMTRHGLKRSPELSEASTLMDSGETTIDQFFASLSHLSNMPAEQIRDEFINSAQLNQQLVQLILKLKENYKIGLVSNANSSHLRDSLSRAGIEQLFDSMVISGELGYIKPSSEIFNHCLDELGIKASEAVFIDDNQGFVEAAEVLGMKGLCYKDVPALKKDLATLGVAV